jgi:hypothetical protein
MAVVRLILRPSFKSLLWTLASLSTDPRGRSRSRIPRRLAW